jgi:hypothetical protein
VFAYGGDPVADGLVDSLNRPGANITGATFIGTVLLAKRMQLLVLMGMQRRAVAGVRDDLDERIHAVCIGGRHAYQATFAGPRLQPVGLRIAVGERRALSLRSLTPAAAAAMINAQYVASGHLRRDGKRYLVSVELIAVEAL